MGAGESKESNSVVAGWLGQQQCKSLRMIADDRRRTVFLLMERYEEGMDI